MFSTGAGWPQTQGIVGRWRSLVRHPVPQTSAKFVTVVEFVLECISPFLGRRRRRRHPLIARLLDRSDLLHTSGLENRSEDKPAISPTFSSLERVKEVLMFTKRSPDTDDWRLRE